MSVVILPGPQQQWEPRELGDKLTVQLPYKALTFTVSSLENVPQYLSCSIHSPLDPNLTNEQAVQSDARLFAYDFIHTNRTADI